MIDYSKIKAFYNQTYYNDCPTDGDLVSLKDYAHLIRHLRIIPGQRALDVACGSGRLLKFLRLNGLEVAGIDVSEKAIGLARKLLGDAVELRIEPAEELTFPAESFDVITCLGAIEHFLYPDIALEKMWMVGKPHCTYIFVVPNRCYLAHLFRSAGTHQQVVMERLMSLQEWRDLFSSTGFLTTKILPDLRPTYWRWIRQHPTTHPRFWLNLIKSPILHFAPLRYQYQFIFHLKKNSFPQDSRS